MCLTVLSEYFKTNIKFKNDEKNYASKQSVKHAKC